MDIGVTLSYSSNVYLNVRARNDVAPTGWIGLGWNLNFGSIICNHKGTSTHDDDDFIWISPAGFSRKIYKKNGIYYIEDDPYTKIVPQDVNADGIFEGWILTDISGKKTKYGNLNLVDDRKATRWTFAWGTYVGPGSSGTPTRYPYQWDVSEIADINGNADTFYYQQDSKFLKVGVWTSPIAYTKASYPLKIVTPYGKRVEFTLESKGDEAYDPYTFQNEPDGFMEMFESKRLKYVKVYSSLGSIDPINTYAFTYTAINADSLGADYKKGLLIAIDNFGLGTTLIGRTQFVYNTDYSKGNKDDAIHYDSNYNYGALYRIYSSDGAIVEMTYAKKIIKNIKISDVLNAQDINELKTGTTSDGQTYFVVRRGQYLDWVQVYNWDGSQWKQTFNRWMADELKHDAHIEPGGDYILCRTGSNDNVFRVLLWKNESWRVDTLGNLSDGVSQVVQYPGNNYFALITGDNQNLLSIYNLVDTGLARTFPEGHFPGEDYGRNMSDGQTSVYAVPQGNFLSVVAGSNSNLLSIFNWTGTAWVRTFPEDTSLHFGRDISWSGPSGHGCDGHGCPIHIVPGNNFICSYTGEASNLLTVFNWTGTVWKRTFPLDTVLYPHGKNMSDQEVGINITTGNNFFTCVGGSNSNLLRVYHWEDSAWVRTFPVDSSGNNANGKDMSDGGSFIHIYPNNNSFGLITGSNSYLVNIFNWNGGLPWKRIFPKDSTSDNRFGENLSTCFPFTCSVTLFPGPNFFITRTGGNQNDEGALTWNGKTWEREIFSGIKNGDNGVNISVNGNIVGFNPGGDTMKIYQKFQDAFLTPIYSYSVSQKKIYPLASMSPVITNFAYNDSTGNYDTRFGTAKFNKVETIIPNHGKTVQYFYNDIATADGQGDSTSPNYNVSYDKLDGMVYHTAAFNQANVVTEGTALSRGRMNYFVYTDTSWPPDLIHKRVAGTISVIKGVTSINDVLTYNNTNGLPYINRAINSDGKRKLSKTFFAFENSAYSSAMGPSGANMLTAPYHAIVYEKAAGDTSVEPLAAQVRSAQVTTWSNALGCNAWMPDKKYTWKVPMNNSGVPMITYTDFNLGSPSLTPDWKFSGENTKYNTFGMTIEAVNPLNIYSTTVYGTAASIPIGSIANASFYESGVFTCDYDLNEFYSPVTYLDKIGGWEKGYIWDSTHNAITNTSTHFGQKSLHLNNGGGGIIRVCKVNGGRGYTFSACARVNSGAINLEADYYTGNSMVASWPVNRSTLAFSGGAASSSQGITNGNWQLMKTSFTVPMGDNYYAVAYIGGTGSYDAYVDDIRFGPSNAKISTTYYDTLWQQPILSVGPDNNPGDLADYDNFGRQSLTYKINKSTGDLTIKSVKNYHLMNETPLFDATKWYKIVTKIDTTRGVDITNGNLSIYEHQPLWLYQNFSHDNQLWKFIQAGDGNYYIQSKANTAFYIDDPYKTIANGAQLQIWDGAGYNQRWNLIPLRDGTYRITCFASGAKAMEYNAPLGEAPSDTMHVQIASYKNKDNQKWVIKAVQ